MEIFVARQPIFDTQLKVFGYELLFRDRLENAFPGIEGDIATSNVLSNAFFSFELMEILRNRPGFINFTEKLITQKTALLFPARHIIIEVLEDVEPSSGIIHALHQMKKKGYRIALDDFSDHKKYAPLVEISDIIKVDFKYSKREDIYKMAEKIKTDQKTTLLAEKVETHEDYARARDMGFQLFQGYFFSRPEMLSKKDISLNQVTKLRLINELQYENLDIRKVESLIKNDVSISYKLLKFLNSAYFKRPNPIHTIKDGITYLGVDELKKFISVIAVSDLNKDKPNELARRSVVRAMMCEKLGSILHTEFSDDELFTLGLFSFMDAMLDHTMEDIIKVLGFSQKMNEALLGRVKSFNTMLKLITSFEKGEWSKDIFRAISGKAIETKLPGYYFESIRMANNVFE
ncbi:EAL and HDOD domain-containing protein [Desulfospira joergensenii]|uniref:EAL and HDOD domain-containing protein n=1 Tax=Desulfospira joergensenii TaxID=53329 RepID=UPI0003B67AD1|nr:HDOD domain-containing protein [Desulfospira joergensenii]